MGEPLVIVDVGEKQLLTDSFAEADNAQCDLQFDEILLSGQSLRWHTVLISTTPLATNLLMPTLVGDDNVAAFNDSDDDAEF